MSQAKMNSTGKALHDRATSLLTAKGYGFVDFGCWQVYEHCGMIRLSWNQQSLVVTTCNEEGDSAQEVEINSFQEFEVLLQLLEVFAFGRTLKNEERCA